MSKSYLVCPMDKYKDDQKQSCGCTPCETCDAPPYMYSNGCKACRECLGAHGVGLYE